MTTFKAKNLIFVFGKTYIGLYYRVVHYPGSPNFGKWAEFISLRSNGAKKGRQIPASTMEAGAEPHMAIWQHVWLLKQTNGRLHPTV